VTEARHVVMSMGADGLLGWDRDLDTVQHVSAREVVILDRIGAGDAMVAGVLHGVLAGDCTRGLHYGTVCAALSLGTYGDQLIVDAAASALARRSRYGQFHKPNVTWARAAAKSRSVVSSVRSCRRHSWTSTASIVPICTPRRRQALRTSAAST